MSNPFENNGQDFIVLENQEGQFSLWPSGLNVPAGWSSVNGPAGYSDCMAFIETHWTDMRPKSLIHATSEAASRDAPPHGKT